MYKDKKILILGGARSGVSAAELLAVDNQVTLTDLKPLSLEDENKLKDLGVNIIITSKQIEILDNSFDLLVKNPGIPPENEVILKAKDLNVLVTNEVEVAYHYLPKLKKLITITGSNGKTTTTLLVKGMLESMGYNPHVGGNIGIAFSSFVKNIKDEDILVLEVSDHQLLDFKDFKSDISVLTNISETHIDYHKTFENYKNSKKRVFNNHTNKDLAIINKLNKDSLEVTKSIVSNKVYFNNEVNYYNDLGIYLDNELIIKKEDIKLEGNHNYENILCALLVVKEIDFKIELIKDFLKTFNGVEHRIEFVKEINTNKFYNDSKSTNPTSTITALKTFNKPIHLILGGLERGQNFHELDNYLSDVKYIYAIGEVSKRVVEFAERNNIICFETQTLIETLRKIKVNLNEEEIVLFSPASASQDQYKNFEERGKEFKKIFNQIFLEKK